MPREIVNASDIGKAAYCSHSLSLSKRNVKSHDAAVKWQQAGTKKHDDLTHAVINGESGQGQDSRCYVASYAFGGDHPVTQSLRDWRDQRLLVAPAGKILVWFYYRLSPRWVRLCRHSLWAEKISKTLVLSVYNRISGRS